MTPNLKKLLQIYYHDISGIVSDNTPKDILNIIEALIKTHTTPFTGVTNPVCKTENKDPIPHPLSRHLAFSIEEDEEEEEENVFLTTSIPVKLTDTVNTVDLKGMFRWIEEDAINTIKEEMVNDKSFDKEKSSRINLYLKKLNPYKPILSITDWKVFDNMKELAPNFEEVIDHYKGNFILNQSCNKEDNITYNIPNPILLLGEPGIGKTYFAKLLAQSLGTSFNFLDANSITASWVLAGSSGQWKSANAGLIFKYMLESSTISPVVIFDEIDKLSSGKNYDPFSTFHQLLESESSNSFQDEYLGINFNASKILYILTANHAHNIPDSLLSRMTVFNIDKPNVHELRKIAQNIYSNIIGASPLFDPILNEKALKYLETFSPRKIKQILNNSICFQSSKINPDLVNKATQLIIKADNKTSSFGF